MLTHLNLFKPKHLIEKRLEMTFFFSIRPIACSHILQKNVPKYLINLIVNCDLQFI